MISFKLYYLTPVYYSETQSNGYLRNIISDFKNPIQTSENQIDSNQFNYSYNEKMTLGLNAQKTLSFAMNKFLARTDEWHENPFVRNIVTGSQLLLEDKYGNQYIFTVTKIDYDIKENNIIYQYTCQDSFSYQGTRQNSGFTIKNDAGSEDFIGALTVDQWVTKYIVPQCRIAYNYLRLEVGLYEDFNGKVHQYYSYQNNLNNVKRIIKQPYSKKDYSEYYETLPFSCSGSTANAALISLGEQLGLQVCVYEGLISSDAKTFDKYFWFEPIKNEDRIGLTYSPRNSIQSFKLSHSGDSLTTVLNVQANQNGDEIVSLFPNIPPLFYEVFSSPEWLSSQYHSGMFTGLCFNKILYYKANAAEDQYFSLDLTRCSFDSQHNWIQVPITDIQWPSFYHYCSFTKEITPEEATDAGYCQVVIALADQEEQDCYSNLYPFKLGFILKQADETISTTMKICGTGDILPNFNLVDEAYLIIPWFGEIPSEPASTPVVTVNNLFINFSRDTSEDELEFAKIAEECPWLENKLIDFSYFYENNLLTRAEYGELIDLLYNKLRIVNGQLMYYSNAYYQAIKDKIEKLSKLTQDLDAIGAAFQADVLTPLTKDGTIKDITSFLNAYNSFIIMPEKPVGLMNYNEILTEYFNKYLNTKQRFLKNIYNFRQYFDAINPLYNRDLYRYYLTIENQWPQDIVQDFDIVSFTEPSFSTLPSNYSNYDELGKARETIFYKDNNQITTAEIVNGHNQQDPNSYLNYWVLANDPNAYIELDNEDEWSADIQYFEYINDDYQPIYGYNKTLQRWLLNTDLSDVYLYYHEKSLYNNAYRLINAFDNIDTFSSNIKNYLIQTISNDKDSEWDWNRYGLYLPFTEVFLQNQADYRIIPNNDENSDVPFTFLRYNAEGKNQVDIKNGNVIGDEKHPPISDPFLYTTWKSIPFINYSNKDSVYRNVFSATTEYWTGVLLYFLAAPAIGVPIIINGTLTTYISNWIWNQGPITPALSGYCSRNAFGESSTASWDAYPINIEDHWRYLSSGEPLTTTWLQYFTQNDEASTEDVYPSHYLATGDAGVTRVDNSSIFTDTNWKFLNWKSEMAHVFGRHLTANFWDIIRDNNNEDYSSSNLSPFFYKDAKLILLNQNSLIYKEGEYRILNLSVCINGSDSKLFDSVPSEWITDGWISETAYYPLKPLYTGLNLSAVNWDKDAYTLDEILGSPNWSNDDYIFSIEREDPETHITTIRYFMVFRREEFETIRLTNSNKESYSYSNSNPVYNIDGGVEKPLNIVDGLFRMNNPNQIDLIPATQFDPTGTEDIVYYKKVYQEINGKTQELPQRIYTLQQILNNDSIRSNYCTFNSTIKQEYRFIPDDTNDFNLSLFKTHYQVENNIIINTSVETIKGNYIVNFKNWSSEDATSDIIIENIPLTINGHYDFIQPISGLSNGTFWYLYKDRLDIPTLYQQAAAIQCQLQEYWSQAYTASKYCEYFLPESWNDENNQSKNFFKGRILQISVPDYTNPTKKKVTLNTQYIPIVQRYNSPSNTKYYFQRQGDWSHDNYLDYLDNQNTTQQDINDDARNNPAYQQMFEYMEESFDSWKVVPHGTATFYYSNEGGTRWNQLIDQVSSTMIIQQISSVSSSMADHYSGIYDMQYRRLRDAYQDATIWKYEDLKEQHEKLWEKLYKTYGYLLLENTYQSSTATTSSNLLTLAKYAFEDYKNPERAYNMTVIDAMDLLGYEGQEIRIGDGIKVAANEYYHEYDQIFDSLSQYLFVSSINYSLRSPTDISLTVNAVRYEDKLIQRLVKLL